MKPTTPIAPKIDPFTGRTLAGLGPTGHANVFLGKRWEVREFRLLTHNPRHSISSMGNNYPPVGASLFMQLPDAITLIVVAAQLFAQLMGSGKGWHT